MFSIISCFFFYILYAFSNTAASSYENKYENKYVVKSKSLLTHPIVQLCSKNISIYITHIWVNDDRSIWAKKIKKYQSNYSCLRERGSVLSGKFFLDSRILTRSLSPEIYRDLVDVSNAHAKSYIYPLKFSEYTYLSYRFEFFGEFFSFLNATVQTNIYSNLNLSEYGVRKELSRELLVILNITELNIQNDIKEQGESEKEKEIKEFEFHQGI